MIRANNDRTTVSGAKPQITWEIENLISAVAENIEKKYSKHDALEFYKEVSLFCCMHRIANCE